MRYLNHVVKSKHAHFENLPILDFSEFQNLKTRDEFLKRLQHTAREIGFFYLVGHGISCAKIQNIQRITQQFFQLSQDQKDKIAMINSPHFRGYSRPYSENTRNIPDFREQIDIGPELEALAIDTDTPLWAGMQGPNQWPENWPEFQEIVNDWLFELRHVARELLQAFMLALGQKPDALDHLVTGTKNELLKLIHYPVIAEKDYQGVGAHKDSNILTLLLQDPIGGLQVLHHEEWLDVPYVENALVINIGEVLELATNGYLVANTHRVISPQQKDRYSVAYFISPSLFAGEISILTLPQKLQELAQGPTSDPHNPILSHAGQNSIKSRLRSHLDVTAKYYPAQYEKLIKNEI